MTIIFGLIFIVTYLLFSETSFQVARADTPSEMAFLDPYQSLRRFMYITEKIGYYAIVVKKVRIA